MKTSLILFSICISLSCLGQEEQIRPKVNEYFKLLEEKKISEALDHVSPELLDMLGKDTFVNLFNQMFNTPGIEFSLGNFKINSISSGFEFDEKTFVLVKYQNKMTFKVDMSNDKEGLLGPILLGTYKRQYGEDNVTFEEPGTYIIDLDKDMYAIQSSAYEGWKIMEYEKTMAMFLDRLIPVEVRNHFKN